MIKEARDKAEVHKTLHELEKELLSEEEKSAYKSADGKEIEEPEAELE